MSSPSLRSNESLGSAVKSANRLDAHTIVTFEKLSRVCKQLPVGWMIQRLYGGDLRRQGGVSQLEMRV